MIGLLKGIIHSTSDDTALIDVNGVGYEVFCSARTLSNCAPGEAKTLVVETHVREDHIHLYGFETAVEREWFRLLTSVQRVGAKMALSILSAHAPDAIAQAILVKDTTAFSRISGIGPKLAERIVAELKDKSVVRDACLVPRKELTKHEARSTNHSLADTLSALTHLGYSRAEAESAARKAMQEAGADAPVDALIKRSLRELA